MGVNNLLSIGNSALFANQVALSTTGNNVANVDTEGYCRQSVHFQEAKPLDGRPGQIGMGTYASEVYRNFNRFIENSYLERFTRQQRWSEQSTVLQSVENIFNEANRDGISSQLSTFFTYWSKLAGTPDDQATREALLAQADSMAALLRDAKSSLETIQREMDDYIRQTVTQVNTILDNLAKVNKQIAITDIKGVNNANALYDDRDRLVRQLAELIDVRVDDKGGSDFSVYTEAGQPLLNGDSVFKLGIQSPAVEKTTANFTGELKFDGSDTHEYSLEFLDGNTFRVSLDGGKSWLRDEDGQISTFTVPPAGQSIRVKSLDISFDSNPGDTFTRGDSFTIVPKTGVYWDSPTRDPINVTPQSYDDGTDNNLRLTGGKLSAYFSVRDYHVGRYMDKLDAFSKALVWEVNSLHSQGAGLSTLTNMQGTYDVQRTDLPLGGPNAGLVYADRLTGGNLTLHFYDANTGESVFSGSLDFGAPWGPNFDPEHHTLEDVAAAVNNMRDADGNPLLHATIEGGRLHVIAEDGISFNAGSDSTGLLAALGLNTFFQGSSASDISLNPLLKQNVAYINAQSVDGNAEANEGDGVIASRIAQLTTKNVRISTLWENSNQTLGGYFGALVGLVGSETQTALFNEQYNTSLAEDLDTRASSITGVNLDEEMTNLIKYQHSYTAAAKLITTADQMLETILGLKQ